jgi:hypothetical protein
MGGPAATFAIALQAAGDGRIKSGHDAAVVVITGLEPVIFCMAARDAGPAIASRNRSRPLSTGSTFFPPSFAFTFRSKAESD